MWKKLIICLLALVGTFSVGYAFYSREMKAAPVNTQFYQPGDAFERSNKNSFEMNGMTWKIFYTDVSSGKGYIASENIVPKYNCPNSQKDGTLIAETYVDDCLKKAQGVYSSTSTSDEIGEMVKRSNGNINLSTLRLLTISEYNKITDNETNMTVNNIINYVYPHFFLADTDEYGNRILFWDTTPTLDLSFSYGNYKYLSRVLKPEVHVSYVSTVMEIDLPQKGIIKTITSDKTNISIPYTDAVNDANQTIINIDTTEGAGPYHFYIYDTNASGTGTYTTPSQYFSLNADSTQGIAKVDVMNKLPVGDYYFKVRVVDESINDRLYYKPSDFTIDPYRTKETGVLHVKITKILPTITFDNPNQTKKTITDAGTDWNETATANPFNSDLEIKYTIVGGDVGLIDLDGNTGKVKYKGNGAFGKVKIRATVDDINPNEDNYNSAFAEKEIVIAREVDGMVIPDNASSDTVVPTFSANDPNVKTNGTIGTIKGILGMPDMIGGSITTYKYEIKNGEDGSLFKVNYGNGIIQSNANLAVGSYNFTITVSDKWTSKDISVTVNVGMAAAENLQFYENSTSNTVINTKTVNFTDPNVSVFATVKGSSNANPVTYSVQGESTNVITINQNTGAITIVGIGTVTIEAEKQGASGQANAKATLTFTVSAGEQNFIYTTDSTLTQEMPKNSSTGKYNTYEVTYEPNKIFNVYTTGNPPGSTVTYQLKAGNSSDVIQVDPDGTVHILNASRSADIGKVTIEATSHDPNGNYTDKTIELPITINRGTRTVTFADDPVYVVNGTGSVTPVILVDGVPDTSGSAVIEVDVNESSTAWTNNGTDIQYSYSGDNGKDIKLKVSLPGNRNYENVDGNGTLHILGTSEAMLTVSTPGKITYGDHFTVRSTQDDSASTNVQYTFTVDNTTYISNGTVNGKQAEFDALKFSGNTEITITVTRTADGEVPLSKKVKVKVLPKPIQITIEDKEKLKGEANPQLTFEDFTAQLVSWNGTTDVIQSSDVKLTTTANQNSPVGSYPIRGDANYLNKTYPNYTFTITDGTLKVIEENIEDHWYHMETDDGQPYQGDWTNRDVNIISDHSDYVNVSKDQSSWNKNFVSVSQEGNREQSFWMKKDSGAITSEKKETIKIDKTAPKVKYIKAKDSNNKLQDIINKLSGGIFFKPGTSFEITTDDKNGQLDVSGTESIAYKIYKQESDKTYGSPIKQDTLTVSNEKANITISETTGTYKVCVIPTDKAGNAGTESCHEVTLKKIDMDEDGDGKPDFNDPDGDGCPDLNIKWKGDDGKWVVINGDRDYDKIPDLNIDSDGDGIPDLNVDTDHDGKPDLNLVILKKSDWKPTTCVNADDNKGIKEEYCTGTSVKPQINVDIDGDSIPDINIDTNGDMKADYNIDSDNDQKADMNMGPTLNGWKPNFCTSKGFIYCTMKELKPVLNIDTDGDGRPDINIDLDNDGQPDINVDTDGDNIPNVDIDSDGDGEPDINIDNDGDGKPDENIIKITEWKPEHNVDDPFPYDTMKFEEKKELEDNGVKVENPGGTFPANVTLKVTDITKDKQSEVSEKAKDLIGEQSVVQVFDVKLIENGKEIQPDGTIKVKIPIKSNIKNPNLLILNENGEYEKVDAIIENGYLIYETDHLGQFTIIGDVDDQEPIDTDVKGAYYPGANMGGALTGDTTNMMMYMGLGCMSIGMMLLILYKRKQAD